MCDPAARPLEAPAPRYHARPRAAMEADAQKLSLLLSGIDLIHTHDLQAVGRAPALIEELVAQCLELVWTLEKDLDSTAGLP